MEISGMLIWVLVLVSLIVFIVLLVKAFKSWGVPHTILLSILFIEAWTFLFFAAGVAHYRIAYTKQHDKLASKVEGLLKTVDMEMVGDRLDPKLNLEKFAPLTNELNRLTLERGRVWRGAILQRATPAAGKTPATAVLQLPARVSNLPAAAPAGAAGGGAGEPAPATAAPVDSGLAVESVVYLFSEKTDVASVPEFYLGEFVVTDIKELILTVSPTTPLTKQQENILAGSPTWAIYELMPLDSHVAFTAAGSSPQESAVFGRMDKDEITKAFESSFRNMPGLSDASKAKILDAYINDGGSASIETLPEALWYQVKFLKDYSDTVDAKGGRSPLEGGYHDSEGNMIDARLKRDSAAENIFKIGDTKIGETYVLDAPTANRLKSQGIVELGQTVFVRPLNDYAFAFRETRRMTIRAKQDAALITRENKEAENTTKVTLDQELKREEESSKLKLDKAQYEKEAEVISSVASELETQIVDKKKELGQLYGSIVALHDRLVKYQRELAAIANSGVLTSQP